MNAQIFSNALSTWLDAHPTLDWMMDHPLGTVGLGLLVIFLFWGLLNAIARFTERFWIALLRSPFTLSQWLVRRSPRLFALFQPKDDPKKQLADAIARLEELRKEEDQLIEQVKALLASQN